jgi:DNA-binding HxlR family transcriptional regulator
MNRLRLNGAIYTDRAAFRIGAGMGKIISIKDRALQSRDALELLSDKWRITVLHVLREGPLRTGQIQAGIDQISPKMLTQTLRGMERDGLIHRKVYSVMPPRVEYELTEMGHSVLTPLQELCHWAKAHVAERDAARKQYDRAFDESVALRKEDAM